MIYCGTCKRTLRKGNFDRHLPCNAKPDKPICTLCNRPYAAKLKDHQLRAICINNRDPNYATNLAVARVEKNRLRRLAQRQRGRAERQSTTNAETAAILDGTAAAVLNEETMAGESSVAAAEADQVFDQPQVDRDEEMEEVDHDFDADLDDQGEAVESSEPGSTTEVDRPASPTNPQTPPDVVIVGSSSDEGSDFHEDFPSSDESDLDLHDSDFESGDEASWESRRNRVDTRESVILNDMRRRARLDQLRREAGLAPDEFPSLILPASERPLPEPLPEECSICLAALTGPPTLRTNFPVSGQEFRRNRWRIPDNSTLSRCPHCAAFLAHSRCLILWHGTSVNCPLCRYEAPGSHRPQRRCDVCGEVFTQADAMTRIQLNCRHVVHYTCTMGNRRCQAMVQDDHGQERRCEHVSISLCFPIICNLGMSRTRTHGDVMTVSSW
jgi:hypothetical protein